LILLKLERTHLIGWKLILLGEKPHGDLTKVDDMFDRME
jgi:hypothetical protein